MNVQQPLYLDKPAFLDWVEGREGRYELAGGQVVMMTGGTIAHASIVSNVIELLRRKLDRKRWLVVADVGVDVGPQTEEDAADLAGVAGSLAALTVALGRGVPQWATPGATPGLLLGIETEARLVRAHDRVPGKTVRLVWGLETTGEPLVGDRRPPRPPRGGLRAFPSPG